MSKEIKPTEKVEEKVVILEGTVSREFIYKKKRYAISRAFKTEDKKLFSQLLTTKRITK